MSVQAVEVFQFNLSQTFREISILLGRYPVVAIDTEFPGYFDDLNQLAQMSNTPLFSSMLTPPSSYQKLKANVDALNLIQLGISLSDLEGVAPKPHSTWQFNMVFNEQTSVVNDSSLALLRDQGINFTRLQRDGIRPEALSYELHSCGLLFNTNLIYVCFHGFCDFGYLIKAITMSHLPNSQKEFNNLLQTYFPGKLYDLKHCCSWVSSLDNLADTRGIQRQGVQHQAGSDAWVTLSIYHSIIRSSGAIPSCMNRFIYGLIQYVE